MWSAPWGWRPGEYSAHRYLMSSYCVLGPRLDTGETVTKANKHLDFWGQRARGADDRHVGRKTILVARGTPAWGVHQSPRLSRHSTDVGPPETTHLRQGRSRHCSPCALPHKGLLGQ